jgi:1,4-dihydroxy-2-naphthoate octaprenyltransferase
MNNWIAALRLKTLPLALGAIILGSRLHDSSSAYNLEFEFSIFLFAAITAICLQILSNLANDYGDFIKGTDKNRSDRQLASGTIKPAAMLRAIYLFVFLSLASGIYLLYISFHTDWMNWIKFLALGFASIGAAISYTVGKKAYGYHGLGDVFVFIFFGLIGVVGTAYLFKQELSGILWLPAIAYGCLCVGVLNVNNIRDLDKDILTNKITLAGHLGREGAIIYQGILLIVAFLGFSAHHFSEGYKSFAPIAVFILGYLHIKKLNAAETEEEYNAQLKSLSLGSLLIVLLFVIRLFF